MALHHGYPKEYSKLDLAVDSKILQCKEKNKINSMSGNTSTEFQAFTRTTQHLVPAPSRVKGQMGLCLPGSRGTPGYQKPSCARKAAACLHWSDSFKNFCYSPRGEGRGRSPSPAPTQAVKGRHSSACLQVLSNQHKVHEGSIQRAAKTQECSFLTSVD